MGRFGSTARALTVATLFAIGISTARAQDADVSEPRVIEEIVVTAQKKEQLLRDVPISMSVLDADFMTQQRIADFRDVSFYAPNVTIDNARNAPDVRIRGFGSPIANQSLEQSVGLVIDGVSYGRIPYWIGPIFDVERVEVLRGPQGTLFGKNTTAGLVNVATRKPSDELTGHVDVEIGELDRRKVELAVGGPLVPGLVNFRLAGITDERDGTMRNTTAAVVAEAPERWLSRDRQAIRGQLGFPDVLGTTWNVTVESVEYSTPGNDGGELYVVQDSVLEFSRMYDPATNADPEDRVGSMDAASVFDADILTFVAEGRASLGEWGLTGIAGHSRLENRRVVNLDPTPAQVISAGGGDEGLLTSGELRFDSPSFEGLFGLGFMPLLERSNLTAGVFYQHQTINDSTVFIPINLPIAAQLVAAASTGVVPPCPACARDVGVDEAIVHYDQRTNSVAGFSQLELALGSRFTLEPGMRLTQEWKDGEWVTSGMGVANGDAALALLGGERFTEDLSRSELAFTPRVAARYDWREDINVYASWGKGFKSGGFNDTTFSGARRELLEFDAERMTAWEAGTKARFLSGALDVNLALFRMTAEDLQLFTTEPGTAGGIGTLATRNAGKARSQGVEVDASWLPVEWLTVYGAFGFDHSEFLEYPLGPCTADNPNTDGDDEPRCDLAGQPLTATPKWSATVTPSVRWPLPPIATVPIAGVDLVGGLTVEWDDVHFTSEVVGDPRTRQPSAFVVGGNIGVASRERGWTFRITGQNLFDEYVAKFSQEGTFTPGTFRRSASEPRLVTASFRWDF